MPCKKIIGFDMDGTLIDSIDIHLNAFVAASKQLNLGLKKDQIKPLFSLTGDVLLKKLIPSIDKNTIDRFASLEKQDFEKHLSQVKPFPDTAEILTLLKKKYKIILVSNTDYRLILKSLEAAGLNPLFFDLIVSYDFVAQPKPYPDELFKAEKILHHNISYYVGDSIVDMKAGKSAKIKTIGITTGVNTKDELARFKPYAIINKLSEIPALLK
jgi:HAD superfamily hydrolase (TIGR01549 family)